MRDALELAGIFILCLLGAAVALPVLAAWFVLSNPIGWICATAIVVALLLR